MSEKHAPLEQERTDAQGYISLLRKNSNFRYLWSGEVVSLLGDWFNLVASAGLVAILTGSGLAVGGLFVVRMLAIFFISPPAGVWADRFNRRTLLILTDISRGIVVLGFLLVREPGDVWLLYALTALQMAISGVFIPAKGAILPDIVSRNELGTANTLSTTTWSVMLALGAALGGVAAGIWGIYPAFVLDALTFFLSALLITRVRYVPPREKTGAGKATNAFWEYIKGIQYLKANRDILSIALLKAAMSLVSAGAFEVLQVSITQNIFVIGERGGTGLGIMYTVLGIGSGLGPVLARRFTGDDEGKLRRAIAFGYLLTAVGLALTAMLSNFGLVLLGASLRAFGSGINWVFSGQLLLMLLPDGVRGRVLATEFALLTLLSAVSSAGAGFLLDATTWGVGGLLWLMTAMTLIAGLLWALWIGMKKDDPPGLALATESQI